LPVVIISHALWNRRYAADPNIIGKPITLNGRAFTVIGVTPPEFRGTNATFRVDLWIPLGMFPELGSGGLPSSLQASRCSHPEPDWEAQSRESTSQPRTQP
jgi:hypothetical protein